MGCRPSTVAVEAAQSDKVAVLVTVEIKTELEAEFLEIMHVDAKESRKEEGCECFHLLKVAGDDMECGGGSECVICMLPVDVWSTKSRMVTPCNHFFHTECLERWLAVKLECPTCRRTLPPP